MGRALFEDVRVDERTSNGIEFRLSSLHVLRN